MVRAVNAASSPRRLFWQDMPEQDGLLGQRCCVYCSVCRVAEKADFRSNFPITVARQIESAVLMDGLVKRPKKIGAQQFSEYWPPVSATRWCGGHRSGLAHE